MNKEPTFTESCILMLIVLLVFILVSMIPQF